MFTLWRMVLSVMGLIALLLHGCATLPKDFERPVSHAYAGTDDTLVGILHRDEKSGHPGQSSHECR